MAQPPRVYKATAIVLRQRKLGDADKIITLYSTEQGKLEAVAKGVRRTRSRLAGPVEPLNHGSYLLARGRNLDIVTQAQTIESFQAIRDDLDRLSRALYVAELLDRATEERAENFALYRLLLDTMRRLSERSDLDLVVRFFEMSLLVQLGYRPEVSRCAACEGSLAAEGNSWASGVGGAVCPRCRPPEVTLRSLSPNALKVLRLLQSERFEELSQLSMVHALGDELERHLRDAIHHALDRDVRSAAFLDIVRRRTRERSVGSVRGAGSR